MLPLAAFHRRERRLSKPGRGDDPPYPLGGDRREPGLGHQVRHRDPHRHRLHRGDPLALHPRRLPPRLPGDAAQKTIFVARYLRDRALQREIVEGLNVVEAWNRANAVIYYGKSGEISSNRREEVEMAALCLRILKVVYVHPAGLSSFQWPSETTSTLPSVTLMAV